MDFRHFFGLCGGSFFPEEYRGDLDAAWEELERARPDVSTAEPEQQAKYLLCLSIYSILTGRLAVVYENMSVLHGLLDKLPPKWEIDWADYIVCTLLADYTRRFPPSLRFCHEQGGTGNIPRLSDIIGPIDMISKFDAMVSKYLPSSDGSEGSSRWFIIILRVAKGVVQAARNLTHDLHPLCPVKSSRKQADDPQIVIAKNAKLLTECQNIAKGGDGNLARYLSRLIAELHIASHSVRRFEVLKELYAACEKQSDTIGMANCKMMEGDDLLSPPFASPISLNLIMTDLASCAETIWDPVEVNLKFEYTDQVEECYETALRLFQDSACKRGQAAVLLRRGCCLHNMARAKDYSDKKRPDLLKEATHDLNRSLELFGRDETNSQVVKAHLILLDITKGHTHAVQKSSRAIAKWAIQCKNELVGHFLGQLMSRFARQEWCKFSRMDTALAAWECGCEVFETLGDMIPMFQTIVSRAIMHHDMFNAPSTKVLIEKAISIVDHVKAYYDAKIQAAPDTPPGQLDRQTLLSSKFNTLSTFGSTVAQIYVRLGDSQRFGDWQVKRTEWIEHDDSFRDYVRRVEHLQDSTCPSSHLAFLIPKKAGLWKTALAQTAAHAKYASSEIQYRRYLEEGDIVSAEHTLRQFVDESETMEQVGFYRMLACERIGDIGKARAILDNLSDDQLFFGYLDEFLRGGAKFMLTNAAELSLTYSIFAEDWKRAYRLVGLIKRISPSFFEYMNEKAIDFAFRIGDYGAIMLNNGQPELAFRRLLEVRRMNETRRSQTADVDARVGSSISGRTSQVLLNLATACIACYESGVPSELVKRYDHGHPNNISWLEHALLFLEETRARAVLDMLQMRSAPDRKIDETMKSLSETLHKRRILRTLHAVEAPSPEQEKEISQLKCEIEELESDEQLATATTFIDQVNSTVEPHLLYQSIDENAVVIEAAFGAGGCIAFAVTHLGIEQMFKGPTRFVDMRKLAMQFMQAMREMTGYLSEAENRRKQRLAELSAGISAVLLVPFSHIIRKKAHVIFSVSNALTAFPFAALIFDGKPLMLHAAVSQIPSLTVLYHISQRSFPSVQPTVSIFAKSPTEESVHNTTDTDEGNLHMASVEAINIARAFSTWPIEASNLSRKEFRQHLKGTFSVLHIGAHGSIDHRNPVLSSISIGEDFRVLDMSAIQIHANLIVFAACLSGLGKATAGDDVLGFSHFVLGTGCQAYMGTLWKVSDFASMLMMRFFYWGLKEQPQLSLARLLRNAQISLFQLDSDRVSNLLDEVLEGWNSADAEGHCPADFAPDTEFLLQKLKMILDQLDWSSPFFWAPFMLMGYGDFLFSRDDAGSDGIH